MSRKVALRCVRKYYPDVTTVLDAKRGTKITVTPKDCANGVGKAPNICAIAKAALRHYDGAIISLSRAYLIKGATAYRYGVPSHVTRELIVFDRSHQFEPGVYRLERVGKNQRLGERPSGTPRDQRKGKKPRKVVKAKHYTGGIRALTRHT
jgi:hypothetical protein